MAYQPKILLYDIENTPLLGHAWAVRETDILQVERHSYLLSFAYSWYPSNHIEVKSLRQYPGYKPEAHDDRKLCKDLWKMLDEADIVVGQNTDGFDNKIANTRFLHHQLGVPSPYKCVDTLKINRRVFRHPSNKLDEVCQYHGIGRKLPHTGKHLWFGCMNGDEKSWSLMEKYNKHDVYLLHKLYDIIKPWTKGNMHPNLNLLTGRFACPVCNSKNVQSRGRERLVGGSSRPRFQCQDCGKWGYGKPQRGEPIEVRV